MLLRIHFNGNRAVYTIIWPHGGIQFYFCYKNNLIYNCQKPKKHIITIKMQRVFMSITPPKGTPSAHNRYNLPGIEDPKHGIKTYSSKKGCLFALFNAAIETEGRWLSKNSARRYINCQIEQGALKGLGLRKVRWYDKDRTYIKYIGKLKGIGPSRPLTPAAPAEPIINLAAARQTDGSRAPAPALKIVIEPGRTGPSKNQTPTAPLPIIDEPPLLEHEVKEVQEEISAAKAIEGTYTAKQKLFYQYFKDSKQRRAIDALGNITIKGQTFEGLSSLTRNPSQKLTAAHGFSCPDIVTLDPANSPHLARHYDLLKQDLENSQKLWKQNKGEDLPEELFFYSVLSYIYEKVFFESDIKDKTEAEKKLGAFIQEKSQLPDTEIISFIGPQDFGDRSYPVIALDDYVKEGLGICKHMSMAAAYFLDRLSKETPAALRGVVQYIRDNIQSQDGQSGGHVWVTFATAKGDLWHLDPRWRQQIKLIEAFKINEGRYQLLNTLYAHTSAVQPIENEISRTMKALWEAKNLEVSD